MSLGQGRTAIEGLYPVIWDQVLSKRTKRLLCKSTLQAIIVYGSEVWSISQTNGSAEM